MNKLSFFALCLLLAIGMGMSPAARAEISMTAKAESSPKETDSDEHGHDQKTHDAKQEDHSEAKGSDEHGKKVAHGDHEDEKPDAHQAAGKPESEHGHSEAGEEEDGHEEEPWADRVGQGKAVEAFEDKGRLQLAEKAIGRLGIKSQPGFTEGGSIRVPRSSVQASEGKPFIYVAQANRWFERRVVKVLGRDRTTLLISVRIFPGERIVQDGAASLRTAELDLMSGEEAGHGH